MKEPELQRLAAYLAPRLAGTRGTTPVSATLMEGGRSNLTYLVRAGERECVLRRPPDGPLPPKAHDVAREFRWLETICRCFPPAPEPWLLCEDPGVIGTPFFVMERRTGIVIGADARTGPQSPITDCGRRALASSLVDTLAALHAIDAGQPAIARLGTPNGFVRRQVHGWIDRWRLARVRDLHDMDLVGAWLVDRVPDPPARPSIVHGDFKLDNVLSRSRDDTRVSSVLDWELAALGDPLVDLAVLLTYWPADPGWPPAAELAGRYGTATGVDLSGFAFYEVFALFRSAAIVQQLAARSRRMGDRHRVDALERRVEAFAQRARARADDA